MTKQDLIDQRELIQSDLIAMLDGLEEEFIDNACQMVVDRFDILIQKLEQ